MQEHSPQAAVGLSKSFLTAKSRVGKDIPIILQQDWRNHSLQPAAESFNYNFLKYKNFLIGE